MISLYILLFLCVYSTVFTLNTSSALFHVKSTYNVYIGKVLLLYIYARKFIRVILIYIQLNIHFTFFGVFNYSHFIVIHPGKVYTLYTYM